MNRRKLLKLAAAAGKPPVAVGTESVDTQPEVGVCDVCEIGTPLDTIPTLEDLPVSLRELAQWANRFQNSDCDATGDDR